MHNWNEIPQVAEVTSDDAFPTTYLILDTRTHGKGVLQILGVADNPRSVKIRYRLVEGVPVKKVTQAAESAARQPQTASLATAGTPPALPSATASWSRSLRQPGAPDPPGTCHSKR